MSQNINLFVDYIFDISYISPLNTFSIVLCVSNSENAVHVMENMIIEEQGNRIQPIIIIIARTQGEYLIG